MSLREELYKSGVERNWSFFRENYDKLTIEDLVWINTKWDSVLPYQKSHSLIPMSEMFKSVEKSSFKVVELGSYRNLLGSYIIDRFDAVSEWHGFDINHAAVEDSIEHPKLFSHKLSKWFWEVDVSGYDVFVSSHTLEHFNFSQFKKVIENVSVCEYLILEIPWQNTWRGFSGSHVLNTTIAEMESLFSTTHEKILDCSKKMWVVSSWKRK